MSIIAVDIGGTKIAGALFSREGQVNEKVTDSVDGRNGDEIGQIICNQINRLISEAESISDAAEAIGVSIPGIYHSKKDTVWAPNLAGWEDYPLKEYILGRCGEELPVFIDSDRSCYILGEVWMGSANGSRDAIFLAVGTGIGAGILTDGNVLHGTGNIAGAIGWMGLNRPHIADYSKYGCFEYHASGEGLVWVARKYLAQETAYRGELRETNPDKINTRDLFTAYENDDPIATRVIREAVEFWGMAAANLVSIFNPKKIIFGGGVFDAAAPLLESIRNEAKKWAQPIAINQVSIELSSLGSEAGIYGAAYLALKKLNSKE